MSKLKTPFGEIDILFDGTPISYTAQEGVAMERLYPDILGRYRISVHFRPDGKEHRIACAFTPDCAYERSPESGERLESQGFYRDDGVKMSIGLEGEVWSISTTEASDEYQYDYDADYLDNGMSYIIKADTKSEKYVFGIAWIDDVGSGNSIDDNDRESQTWFAADPTYE